MLNSRDVFFSYSSLITLTEKNSPLIQTLPRITIVCVCVAVAAFWNLLEDSATFSFFLWVPAVLGIMSFWDIGNLPEIFAK